MGGIIFINTDNYPTFCDSRCDNTGCNRHITKAYQHQGGCKISKLRDTDLCEGCIPRKRRRKVTESDT